jgi:hypothetical protein
MTPPLDVTSFSARLLPGSLTGKRPKLGKFRAARPRLAALGNLAALTPRYARAVVPKRADEFGNTETASYHG